MHRASMSCFLLRVFVISRFPSLGALVVRSGTIFCYLLNSLLFSVCGTACCSLSVEQCVVLRLWNSVLFFVCGAVCCSLSVEQGAVSCVTMCCCSLHGKMNELQLVGARNLLLNRRVPFISLEYSPSNILSTSKADPNALLYFLVNKNRTPLGEFYPLPPKDKLIMRGGRLTVWPWIRRLPAYVSPPDSHRPALEL